MKLLRYCIYLFMCVSVLVSCTQDDSGLSSHDSSKLSIQLQLGQPTRATIDGEDDLNENQISTVDIFLFMAEANENDAPIYSSSIPESLTLCGYWSMAVRCRRDSLMVSGLCGIFQWST